MFGKKCIENSLQIFACVFFCRFCETKARIKFWAQSQNCQLVYKIVAVKTAKPQLAYKVEVEDKNN